MSLPYSQINAITKDLYLPAMVDTIFASNVAFNRFKKSGQYKKGSGNQVVQPLLYATNAQSGWFTGAGTLTVTDTAQFTGAVFPWSESFVPITITKIDEAVNSGAEQVVNLITAKTEAASMSLAATIGTALYEDGSVTSSFDGWKLALAVTGDYASIAKQTYAWWRGNVDSTTTVISYPKLRALIGACTIDSQRPTVIYTTQAIFDDILALIQPQQRIVDSSMADLGFQNVKVDGIPVIVDAKCPAGYLFAINEKSNTLWTLEDFRFDPFIAVSTSAVKTARIFWTGTLACANPRLSGMMTALV
jgi:hypothetical protein